MASQLIAAKRAAVYAAYENAKAENQVGFLKGDPKCTSEYIYKNQIDDAKNIVEEFRKGLRIVSISKKTKVGMDGLMVEIATRMTTDADDHFVVDSDNVRILTGMSNAGWEKGMKEKCPTCFKDKIFHHGKLQNSELQNLKNSLIIIDEIDAGSNEKQVLHRILKDAGLLNITLMKENNNRFVFTSATIIRQLYATVQWGDDLHTVYKMTIPPNYIGHIDFLNKGIVQEFYPMNTRETAEKWVQEDILDNYESDYRVHIARVQSSGKSVSYLQDACNRMGIAFRNHTSKKEERISDAELKELFDEPLREHIVLAVKGLLRRANLIPNKWKLRIGATHELCVKVVDNSVLTQGLPGRMTGYWRDIIDAGHKTGPHRTSIKSIRESEAVYEDPYGNNSYNSHGFAKKNGKVTATPMMLSPRNITGLIPVPLPAVPEEVVDVNTYRIYSDVNVVMSVLKMLGYRFSEPDTNSDGFHITSLRVAKTVVSLADAVKYVPKARGGGGGGTQARRYYPCYIDTSDVSTLRFVVILEPTLDAKKIGDADAKYPSIPYTI